MKRRSAPHIYTITGNLLWEQTLTFADWAPGRGQRAVKEYFQVGGKGINVSKMLNRLGAPNTALCFTGGFSGAACAAWLKAGQFDFRAFPAAGATRAGTVVRGGLGRETTFLGPDASPGPAAVRACAAYLKARPDGGVLAICGSLPGWENAEFRSAARSPRELGQPGLPCRGYLRGSAGLDRQASGGACEDKPDRIRPALPAESKRGILPRSEEERGGTPRLLRNDRFGLARRSAIAGPCAPGL